jgi:hypothetical protein
MIRGKAHTPNRSRQERDFSGLTYGKITPTDLDGVIEYHDKGYVLIEVKVNGNDMPTGQRLALERLCDDLQNTKPTILIVGIHDTPSDEAIDFGACVVEKYRYKGAWYPDKKITDYIGKPVKYLVDWFIKWIG